jgi:hypothetical protein
MCVDDKYWWGKEAGFPARHVIGRAHYEYFSTPYK